MRKAGFIMLLVMLLSVSTLVAADVPGAFNFSETILMSTEREVSDNLLMFKISTVAEEVDFLSIPYPRSQAVLNNYETCLDAGRRVCFSLPGNCYTLSRNTYKQPVWAGAPVLSGFI